MNLIALLFNSLGMITITGKQVKKLLIIYVLQMHKILKIKTKTKDKLI